VSDDSDHLADLSDGAGCAEVWEHLSAERDDADADGESDPDDGSSAPAGGEVDSEDAITPDSNPSDDNAATADATDAADAAADESSEGETTGASYV
jgi:hypothetical protein